MGMSKAQIFTMALRHMQITTETIQDPDDTEDALAVVLSAMWDKQVPKELEQHDWQIARAGRTLGLASAYESIYTQFDYCYFWPANCLAPRYIEGVTRDDNVPFRIGLQGEPGAKEKLIYTNRETPFLIYTDNVTRDYAHFSFSFGAALSARLALEFSMFRLGGGESVKGLEKTYAYLLSEAKAEDAQLVADENWTLMQTTRYEAARDEGGAHEALTAFSQPYGAE